MAKYLDIPPVFKVAMGCFEKAHEIGKHRVCNTERPHGSGLLGAPTITTPSRLYVRCLKRRGTEIEAGVKLEAVTAEATV